MKKRQQRKNEEQKTPKQKPLIKTQSIDIYDNPKDASPIIPQRSKLNKHLHIFERPLTLKQKQFLELATDKQTKLIFVSGPAGTSKAQPMDADVFGEFGWIKMGDILPNSKIYGEDGKLHTVVSIHPQGKKEIYKVSFSDGTSTECSLDHLWKTQTSDDRNHRKHIGYKNGKKIRKKSKKEGTIKTTKEIKNSLYIRNNSRKNHSIPIINPIEIPPKPHIISPYLMGILLGDGCFRHKGYISFSTGDEEILKRVSLELDADMEIHHLSKYDYSIVHKSNSMARKKGNKIKNELLRLKLHGLKSNKKFIPNEYLIDSIENRIELLRGLMDSDGHITKLSTIFTTTSHKLEIGIRFLVESMGGICRTNLRRNFYTYLKEKKEGLNSYSMCISMPPDINPFYISRKYNLVVPRSKYKPIRYIVDIEYVGEKDCQCILVDNPSHLYLTNNFIVTHNTFLAVLASLKLMNEKRVSDLTYIRSAVESSDSKLGFLPGEAAEKMAPYIQPLVDKLSEFLSQEEIKMLMREERVDSIPVGFLRGLNWNAKAIVADEAQNLTHKELFTLITRIGEFSKVFILGDPDQSDINGKSGFFKMVENFDDDESKENGIHTFRFTEDDIVRSKLVKFIIKKVKKVT